MTALETLPHLAILQMLNDSNLICHDHLLCVDGVATPTLLTPLPRKVVNGGEKCEEKHSKNGQLDHDTLVIERKNSR